MAKKKAKPVQKEKDEDEEIVVLCFKVLIMPRPPVAGCSKVPCSSCRQSVWISPATMAHMVGKKHRICCAECAANEADDDMQVMPPSEEQIAEMVAADPTIDPAKVRRMFPVSNPAKRKAALEDILKQTRKRKRIDN